MVQSDGDHGQKEMVGMAMSIAIVILKLDKRNGLMSLLESINDVVRCHRWQRYNSEWDLDHVP
jgi:hypothetical protein